MNSHMSATGHPSYDVVLKQCIMMLMSHEKAWTALTTLDHEFGKAI